MMSIQVIDRSGSQYLSVFDEIGRVILGKSAEEINSLKSQVMQYTMQFTMQDNNNMIGSWWISISH